MSSSSSSYSFVAKACSWWSIYHPIYRIAQRACAGIAVPRFVPVPASPFVSLSLSDDAPRKQHNSDTDLQHSLFERKHLQQQPSEIHCPTVVVHRVHSPHTTTASACVTPLDSLRLGPDNSRRSFSTSKQHACLCIGSKWKDGLGGWTTLCEGMRRRDYSLARARRRFGEIPSNTC